MTEPPLGGAWILDDICERIILILPFLTAQHHNGNPFKGHPPCDTSAQLVLRDTHKMKCIAWDGMKINRVSALFRPHITSSVDGGDAPVLSCVLMLRLA